jgi:hypothetical protein
VTADGFVPVGFDPPTSLVTEEFRLEPLGPQHNEADHAFTVLDPDDDVVGCVYLYPAAAEDSDVTVESWVRADRSELDGPLGDAVAGWLAADWPWTRVDRCGR